MIHVFSVRNVIQKIWSKLREWLSPELNLLALTPQNATLGILAKDAPFALLLNHILILFKQGYINAATQTFHQTSIILRENQTFQKIEYKIAQDNDCLFSHLRKWEKYCISF